MFLFSLFPEIIQGWTVRYMDVDSTLFYNVMDVRWTLKNAYWEWYIQCTIVLEIAGSIAAKLSCSD